MFTGLVEELGTVRSIHRKGNYQLLTIDAHTVCSDLKLGDSISVNGVCQTITSIDDHGFSVETLSVSLKKTSLGSLKKGAKVNLERALAAGSRMGGHLVQGHVDGVGRISAIRRHGENIFLEIILPEESARFCVAGSSITIEGISLTIADLRGSRITLNIIPSTWQTTVLSERKVGEHVNLEVDIMARYVARMLDTQFSKQGAQHE